MERVCFILRLRPDRVTEYRARHHAIWPEMRVELAKAGWHNYTLFIREDGTLIGYLECEDFVAARAAMAGTTVNAQWQAVVGSLFADLEGKRPDALMHPLEELFHLD
ncbi:MAG: L-rhamnose mutarotase [Candidatus Dormibacteria bacterium]